MKKKNPRHVPYTQDKCEQEISGADYSVTKEFIVKLLPALVLLQHWGRLEAGKGSSQAVQFPSPLLTWTGFSFMASGTLCVTL